MDNSKQTLENISERINKAHSTFYGLYKALCILEENATDRGERTMLDLITCRMISTIVDLEKINQSIDKALSEQETTIDNDEPVTEDDLPFDGKEEKE